MSLLLNEEFSIYQLRAGYLHNIKDGVGERLITLNTAVFNDPAFRSAGWTADSADVKRAYSPPIPTNVVSDYFNLPTRAGGDRDQDTTDRDEGALITSYQHGSNDTLGPPTMTMTESRRKQRREMLDENDSSDLSDDSDDDDEIKTAAQSIKFSKMPVRDRSGSSPARTSDEQPDSTRLLVSPSGQITPGNPALQYLRRGSFGAVDAIKQRPRRDTVNSSEMSSESETTEPWPFRRQKVQTRNAQTMPYIIHEEESRPTESDLEDDDLVDIDDASDLSDDFRPGLTLGIDLNDFPNIGHLSGRPPASLPHVHDPIYADAQVEPLSIASKPSSLAPPLSRLPSKRPVSFVQPASLLSKALKSQGQTEESPLAQFAHLSGKVDPDVLWFKIYAPFSSDPSVPLEVPIRARGADDSPTKVVELIGFCLYLYNSESRTPALDRNDSGVNRWTLRMTEDDEVDFDFPALGRARPVTDYSSNNNASAKAKAEAKKGNVRPVRTRAGTGTPWDAFALVKASDEQYEDNKKITAQYEISTSSLTIVASPSATGAVPALAGQTEPNSSLLPSQQTLGPSRSASVNPTLPFNPDRNMSIAMSGMRKDSSARLDLTLDGPTAPQRSAVTKTVTIHYVDPQTLQSSAIPIATASDTYIAELLSQACQRLHIDKSQHLLKVRGTQTVAPQDRTIDALGEHTRLDMVRRRFIGMIEDGTGTSHGSPRSESPNALILPSSTSPAKTRRKPFGGILNPSSTSKWTTHNGGLVDSSALLQTLGTSGKRYNVVRKQPLSFVAPHARTLAIEGEYIHVMPATMYDALGGVGSGMSGKATSVHLTCIVGCKVSRKHPKIVRILVYREKDLTKRYDFEAASKEEAQDIVAEIRRGVEKYSGGDDG